MLGSAALHTADADAAPHHEPVVLDLAGRRIHLDAADAARLPDTAAASAGRSSAVRDLALLLDRALQGRRVLALRRSDAQTLRQVASKAGLASLVEEMESAAA